MKIDKNFAIKIGEVTYPAKGTTEISIKGTKVVIKRRDMDGEITCRTKDLEFVRIDNSINKVGELPDAYICGSCKDDGEYTVAAPLEVVKKAVAEVLAERLERTVEVEMNIDGKTLGKWIHKYTD